MENRDYKVKRDDIYFGALLKYEKKDIRIFEDGLYEFLTEKDYQNDISISFECQMHELEHLPTLGLNQTQTLKYMRTMLFVVNEEHLADDLLYSSPHYPIFNISDNNACLSTNIALVRSFKISRILKDYNYPEILTYEDILKIKNTFFKDFLLDNCTLFGRKDTGISGSGCETFDRYGRHRTFNGYAPNGVFPECYFRAFWSVNRWNFYPNQKEEGIIKALKK